MHVVAVLAGIAFASIAVPQASAAGDPAASAGPHVATNAILAASSTESHPNGVWRDDYAPGIAAPPLYYRAMRGNCSAHGLVSDGGACQNSANGGAWIAAFPAFGLDVREFGAKCDGSANDSASIQNAINIVQAGDGGRIIIPPSVCIASVSITSNNISIVGVTNALNGANGSKIAPPDPASSAITVGHVSGFELTDVQVVSLGRQMSGTQILLDKTVDATFHNVTLMGGYDGIKLFDVTMFTWVGGGVRNWNHNGVFITGDVINNGGNDFYFVNFIEDEDNSTYTPNAGIYADQTAGAIALTNVDILHAYHGIWLNPGRNQYAIWLYGVNLYLDTCQFHPTDGVGLYLTPHGGGNVSGVRLTNSWASTCVNNIKAIGDNLSRLDTISLSQFDSYNAQRAGLVFDYATNVELDGVSVAGNSQSSRGSYAGIEIGPHASHVRILGGRSGSPVQAWTTAIQKFGLQVDAGFTGTLFAEGMDLTGNVTSGYHDDGNHAGNIQIVHSAGYNPRGPVAVTPERSPWTYVAGHSPETLFLTGVGISADYGPQLMICSSAKACVVTLAPNQSACISYSSLTSAVANRQ